MTVKKLSSWHVSVAAEAIAAAQFARLGFDVSVQYGANQPEYDLVVVRGDRLLKISVKGSQEGAWGLTQSYLKRANYHAAADAWLAKHGKKTAFCFVQFFGVDIIELPRVYLATPGEVADRLKASAGGRGYTVLYENYTWTPRARGAGTVDRIPPSWAFSDARVLQLFERA